MQPDAQETEQEYVKSESSIKVGTLKFEQQVVGYQAKAPLSAPMSMIVITLMNAYFAHDSVRPLYWITWMTLSLAVIAFRLWYLARVHASTVLTLKQKLNRCITMATINGFMHASILIFFSSLSFTERSILTLTALGLISGSIVTTHGYRRLFIPYASPVVFSLSACWALTPLEDGGLITQLGITSLILIFFGTQISTSKRYLEAVRESFSAHEAHLDLNKRLNQELKSSKHKEEQLTELNQKLNTVLEEAVNASESKTRFLALASHDLRQPIHTLSLFSAALSLRPLDDKSATIAARMETAVGNLASQMDSLLDISKLDAGMVDPLIDNIDLIAFLERMSDEYQNIANEEDLKFSFISSVSKAAVKSDPELLERIIRNLLGNAIKYTDTGSITMTLKPAAGFWQVLISDTGQGISDANKAKIFEEFYQVDNPERNRMKGLGLGLAIVKRLSQLLSVKLEFESELGKGTSFSLSLPIVQTRKFPKQAVVEIPQIKGLKILCVDDEVAIREAVEDLLGGMGCSVFTCRGTAEAVELGKQIKPDVLLADFRLIGDDSGLKTVAALREIHADLPAILVSGDTAPERLKQAKEAGIPMLHKPVSAEQLQSMIAEIVNT